VSEDESGFARFRRGGVIGFLGDRVPTSDPVLGAVLFVALYPLGVAFMVLGRAAGAEIDTGDLFLGAIWIALPASWFGVRDARTRNGAAPRIAAPTAGGGGVPSFLSGAFALAVAQWAVGGLRLVLWPVGLVLVTIGLRTGTKRQEGRSRVFHGAVAVGAGVWLASVVMHAIAR